MAEDYDRHLSSAASYMSLTTIADMKREPRRIMLRESGKNSRMRLRSLPGAEGLIDSPTNFNMKHLMERYNWGT